jgi:hypothetical protein
MWAEFLVLERDDSREVSLSGGLADPFESGAKMA